MASVPNGALHGTPSHNRVAKTIGRQFCFFLVNGGVLGVIAWAAQLGLFALLGGSTGGRYAAATSIVYLPLILANFAIQRDLIFSKRGSFGRFILVSLMIMVLVSGLSPAARWCMTQVAGATLGNDLGFMAAALLMAPVSFLLTRFWVFAR